MTNAPRKPLPTTQPEWDFYWEKTKQNELWIMRCKDCGQAYFYPRAISPCCFSRNTEWIKASGKGTLHAFGIVHRAPSPAFAGDVPYVAAFVDLEEGCRMPSNLVISDPTPENVKVGMPVEVTFEQANDDYTLPKFKPA